MSNECIADDPEHAWKCECTRCANLMMMAFGIDPRHTEQLVQREQLVKQIARATQPASKGE